MRWALIATLAVQAAMAVESAVTDKDPNPTYRVVTLAIAAWYGVACGWLCLTSLGSAG
jgi:hypothetical protein